MSVFAELPDGRQLEFPDGTDPAVVQATVKKVLGVESPSDGVGPAQAAMIGAGKTATRIGQGMQQLWYGLTGDEKKAAELKQQVANENETYAPLAAARPFATGIGEALPAMAVPIGAAASLPAAMGRAAIASAVPAALEYGNVEDRAKNAAIQGAGGAAGALGGYMLGRAVTPIKKAADVSAREVRALAGKSDVPLTPAQATGSPALSALEGTLSQLPGSSAKMGKVQQTQRQAFNKAALGLLGENADTIGNDAAKIAQNNIGGRIEAAAKGVQIPQDMTLIGDLAQVESNHLRNLLPDQKKIVTQYIDDILKQGNTMLGEDYQKWRSRIGARAASTQDSELKSALKGIQKALDSAFDRAAPAVNADAMQAARGQYQNLKTLGPLMDKAEMTSRNIPPAQVLNRAMASGNKRADMKELARLGQTIGKEYPNSGTPARLFWQDMMTNPARIFAPQYMLGATGLPWAAAQTYNSTPMQKYLANTLLNDPAFKALTKGGGLLGLALENAAID